MGRILIFPLMARSSTLEPGTPRGKTVSYTHLRYIFRVELDADALGNGKMILDGADDLLYAVCRQGRSAAAEVQAGDGLFPGGLASCQMDLPDQGVDVPAACLL